MIARVPLHVSDSDLRRISEENPGWHIERTSEGTVEMSPSGAKSGQRSIAAALQLAAWAGGAGPVFGAESGFKMPDGSVVSPDACWIAEERWDQLSADEQEGYASIVPDVIVEIASPSDAVADLKRKAERYRNYGASYVVVIDPFGREVTAYGVPPEGLALDTEAIFDP